MKATKLRHIFYIVFLVANNFSFAQDREHLKKIIATTENIGATKMSENGNWSGWRKFYDGEADTLVIKSNTSKTSYRRTKALDYQFLTKNTALVNYVGKVEWLDLNSGRHLEIHPIFNSYSLSDGNYFAVLEEQDNQKKIVVYKSDMATKITEMSVDRVIYNSKQNSLFAIQRVNESNHLLLWKDDHFCKIYQTADEMELVVEGLDKRHVAIVTKSKLEERKAILLDVETQKIHTIQNPKNFETKLIVPTDLEMGKWQFNFFEKDKEEKQKIVDVWYSDDNILQEKHTKQDHIAHLLYDLKSSSQTNLNDFNFERVIPVAYDKAIAYNTSENENYIKPNVEVDLHLIDLKSNQSKFITKAITGLVDVDATKLLACEDGRWSLYNFLNNEVTKINKEGLTNPKFVNNSTILFEMENGVWSYNLQNKVGNLLLYRQDTELRIFQNNKYYNASGNVIIERSAEHNPNGILIEQRNTDNSQTILHLFKNDKTKPIIKIEGNSYRNLFFNKNFTQFQWVEENHNVPPKLIRQTGSKSSKTVYSSNAGSNRISSLKKEVYSYQNDRGQKIRGILYYPLHFQSGEKYPMIVYIYEKLSKNSNDFTVPTLKDQIGFNIHNLISEGYFVFIPDIVYDNRGPGLSAVACVHAGLDTLLNIKEIDTDNIGLTGFSFGGYETNFIATKSNRFKTYISGGSLVDTVSDYFLYNYHWKSLNYSRYETKQFRHGQSFFENRAIYFENNPLYSADKIKKPMLLFTGTDDKNVPWDNTVKLYSALRRNKSKVIALFYPNEAHGLINTDAQVDLSLRTLDWWDYFLKGKKKEWIDIELN